MSRAGWLDCTCGVSGDMLLGALHEVGALTRLPALLDSLHALGVDCAMSPTERRGIAATTVRVAASADQPPRRLNDVLAVVNSAAVADPVRERATRIFRRLADVEARIHRTEPDQVHFHEVGAVDSIVDVLGACLGLHELQLDSLVVSPLSLGAGSVTTDHGMLPVPAPAVLGLLQGSHLAAVGGPIEAELATPTGVALLAEWATASGPMPTMTVNAVGTGAGSRDLPDRANIVRLVVGDATHSDGESNWQTIEANVDDLDPRLWPGVLDRLLQAGAADAWLTPILMKKGRPAHTVTALVAPEVHEAVRGVLVSETSTIGVRSTPVTKHALERSWVTVDVDGQKIRVKLAHDGRRRTNLAPEFEDVAAAAAALGVPAKDVLARAAAAAWNSVDG